MRRLTLYGTAGCHLCEDAIAVVVAVLAEDALAFEWAFADIAGNDALLESYGVRIPVLREADSERELDWPFDRDRLKLFLR